MVDNLKQNSYILIVDDDPFYGSILKTKLGKEGFEVSVAKNGKEAMTALKSRRPQLMVSNLIMPVEDGFTLLKALRAEKEFADLKVLVLSNLGEEEDKKKVFDLHAVDYIVKVNVALGEIVEKIKHHCQ